MTYTISKDHHFSASHHLAGLPDDHPCTRLHGHNYRLRVTLKSLTVDQVGFVADYHALTPFLRWVDDMFDHRHLNDVVSFNPTAELLARHFTEQAIQRLPLPDGVWVSVAVSETPKTWAEWAG